MKTVKQINKYRYTTMATHKKGEKRKNRKDKDKQIVVKNIAKYKKGQDAEEEMMTPRHY
jgi:hypothetical protein